MRGRILAFARSDCIVMHICKWVDRHKTGWERRKGRSKTARFYDLEVEEELVESYEKKGSEQLWV